MPVDFQVCSWLLLSALLDDSSTMFTFGWPLDRCVHRSLHICRLFLCPSLASSRRQTASRLDELPLACQACILAFCGYSEQEALKKACPNASMLHEGSVRVRYIVCTFVEGI